MKHNGPEYEAYRRAKRRCINPRDAAYPDYGGRGILFKFSSFNEFLLHIGPRPSDRHSLDRRNNDGHYEFGNVRWATPIEQVRNRRRIFKRGPHEQTLEIASFLLAGLDLGWVANHVNAPIRTVRRIYRNYIGKLKQGRPRIRPVRKMNGRPRGRPRKRRICFVPYSENFYQMLARIRAEH